MPGRDGTGPVGKGCGAGLKRGARRGSGMGRGRGMGRGMGCGRGMGAGFGGGRNVAANEMAAALHPHLNEPVTQNSSDQAAITVEFTSGDGEQQ